MKTQNCHNKNIKICGYTTLLELILSKILEKEKVCRAFGAAEKNPSACINL
jgi:hypothetical protein